MNLDNRNAGEFIELCDSKLEELIDEVGYIFSSSETILGYVTLRSGKKAQVTMKVESDKDEWISD